MTAEQVAVLGVGMHPWGKWGRNFVEYGVAAARDALADAGIDWRDVGFVAGADTMRNGYPGYVAGATFAQALGWTGIPVTSTYGACASGAMALDAARQRILPGMCDVALVVGADTTPKGFLAPNKGERGDDPDWLRFRLLGATNPTYFAMCARRRIDLYGATHRRLRPGEGQERRARPREPDRPVPQGGHRRRGHRRVADRCRPAAAARHLRHVRRWRRGGADVAWTTPASAGDVGGSTTRCGSRPSRRSRRPSRTRSSRCRTSRPTPPRGSPAPERGFKAVDRATPRTRRPASAPTTSTSPRSTTSRPHSSSTGTRTSASASPVRPRSCSATATPPSAGASRSTRPADSPASARPCPPRPSRRCASSPGSSVAPPRARQVERATVGITANQGLFGHGSSVILTK